jgi:tetratricopeptide (TPR) repeat protein
MNKVLLIVSGLLIGNLVFAQNTIRKAFQESYQLELKADFTNAVKILKTVYVEDSYELNLRLGWLTYEAGKFTESISFYNKAISLMPYGEEAKFGLIYPKAALGKWNDIIGIYQEILKISPNNVIANYRLGLIYYERKDYQKAYPYFKKDVDLYPFTYDYLLMYAWTSYQLGKMREAKVLFNKVLMISPEDTSALEGLGLMKK